jgi:HSP20 family protein
VLDGDDAYVVTADLPGFEAEDIDVTLEGGVLRIDADRDVEAGSEETTTSERGTDRYIYHERTLETVSRTVRLPEPVDEESVTANHSNGVLTVELPKRDSDEGHQIDVQ